MRSRALRRSLLVGLCLGLFVAGFLCGSVSQHSAQAQLPGGATGALGSVTELGSAITDIQQHITGLQKSVETLKQVQGALGGGK